MVKREFVIATLVGIILFITDLIFGWMTFLAGPIPVIFIMTAIIGIFAGKVGDAVKATFLTWLFGILLGCLLAPIIFAEFWSGEGFLPILPLIIMLWSTRGMFIDYQFEGTWIEANPYALSDVLCCSRYCWFHWKTNPSTFGAYTNRELSPYG